MSITLYNKDMILKFLGYAKIREGLIIDDIVKKTVLRKEGNDYYIDEIFCVIEEKIWDRLQNAQEPIKEDIIIKMGSVTKNAIRNDEDREFFKNPRLLTPTIYVTEAGKDELIRQTKGGKRSRPIIHTGKRGGKYVMKGGKKKYI